MANCTSWALVLSCTLYAGCSFSAAFVETLLRQPQLPFVEAADLEALCMSEIESKTALKLVDLRGAGLSKIGADNSLSSGPYEIAGRWALALWSHADKPDGILYRSRHDPDHAAAAIFDRAPIHLRAATHGSTST